MLLRCVVRMGGGVAVDLAPITDADVAMVADFLHGHMNHRVSPSTWSRAMSVPWMTGAPNHGFMLRDGQRVVGVYLAFYSERRIAGRAERFCNLGSWCVVPEYRFHSVRLLKALLAQDGYHFTDLTPIEKVESVDAGLKFRYLDTSLALVPHLPWPSLPHRTRISADPDTIASALTGPALKVYRDHAQAPAAHHLVLIRGSQSCYVMFRKHWWRELSIFADILYVSNQSLFQDTVTLLARYLLVHCRLLATFAELRIVGTRPRTSFMLPHPKTAVRRRNPRLPRSYAQRYRGMFPPKMYRSASLEPDQIDELYSDLVCIP
jgi:hypothetical protein